MRRQKWVSNREYLRHTVLLSTQLLVLTDNLEPCLSEGDCEEEAEGVQQHGVHSSYSLADPAPGPHRKPYANSPLKNTRLGSAMFIHRACQHCATAPSATTLFLFFILLSGHRYRPVYFRMHNVRNGQVFRVTKQQHKTNISHHCITQLL